MHMTRGADDICERQRRKAARSPCACIQSRKEVWHRGTWLSHTASQQARSCEAEMRLRVQQEPGEEHIPRQPSGNFGSRSTGRKKFETWLTHATVMRNHHAENRSRSSNSKSMDRATATCMDAVRMIEVRHSKPGDTANEAHYYIPASSPRAYTEVGLTRTPHHHAYGYHQCQATNEQPHIEQVGRMDSPLHHPSSQA